MNDIKTMNHAADNIRILTAAMVEKAKSGHPGGAMGGADFINVLYSEYLQYDPENPTWEGRDRLFLDPGHMSPMLYSVLTMTGHFTLEDLQQFRQWGSNTPGHPELNVMRGVENSSGPLGQGHTYGIGAAIAANSWLPVPATQLSIRKQSTFISLTVVSRKKYLKVPAVWQVTWAWTMSSCSMMPTTSSFQLK